jgi:hypothetical protein
MRATCPDHFILLDVITLGEVPVYIYEFCEVGLLYSW